MLQKCSLEQTLKNEGQLIMNDHKAESVNLTSMENKIRTVHQLNMSCTVAAEKASSNSFLFPIWVMATKVLVTEVPMLAPMIMGMAM